MVLGVTAGARYSSLWVSPYGPVKGKICARCRCTCESPAVKFRDNKNKEGKETLKMAVVKRSYFYESHCIAYPLRQAPFFP